MDNATSLPSAISSINTMLSGMLVYYLLIFVFFAALIAMRNKAGDDAILIAGSITAFLAIMIDVSLSGTLNSAVIMIPIVCVIMVIIYKAFNKKF
jgi:hypothetical protein